MKKVSNTNQMSSDLKKILKSIISSSLKGDYIVGEKIASDALQKYPNHPEITYQYAKMMGDGADLLPSSKKKKQKNKAIQLLIEVIKNIHKLSPEKHFGVYLNLFYQSEDYKKMFNYGLKLKKSKDKLETKNGLYASGIGAALYSQRLYGLKKWSLSKNWAEKSTHAWKDYPLHSEKYYYPFYVYALSLALSGDSKNALIQLKKATKLSQRKIEDEEFKDVLGLLKF